MSGGWAGSTRHARLPAGWAQIRIQRLRLDGFRCQWPVAPGVICGALATDVDHIEAMTDDHALEALQSLCSPHHRAKCGQRGRPGVRRAGKAQGSAQVPQAEAHPGLRRLSAVIRR